MSEFPRPQIMDVVAENGVPFRVVYGHREYLNGGHSKYPVVTFYDRRYSFTPDGQFISDYHVSTILDRIDSWGLDLYGGVDSWTVDTATMQVVKSWLENNLRNGD